MPLLVLVQAASRHEAILSKTLDPVCETHKQKGKAGQSASSVGSVTAGEAKNKPCPSQPGYPSTEAGLTCHHTLQHLTVGMHLYADAFMLAA
jgi:hypothetical protein